MNEDKGTKDIFNLFAGTIILASSILTFGFFFTFLPALVVFLDANIAALISGTLGVLIFDGGALVWLRVYLHGCENDDQRNIALQTSVIDITGSAVASFVQIFLTGTGLIALSDNFKWGIGLAALIVTGAVLTWNFVAVWRFRKNSDASKESIREGKRQALIRAEEDKQLDELDKMIASKVSSKLQERTDELAEARAQHILQTRLTAENAKGVSPSRNGHAVVVESNQNTGVVDFADTEVSEPPQRTSPNANGR